MHGPQYLKPDLNPASIICMVCEQLAVDGRSVAAMKNKK